LFFFLKNNNILFYSKLQNDISNHHYEIISYITGQ